jgi:hypothetical protein
MLPFLDLDLSFLPKVPLLSRPVYYAFLTFRLPLTTRLSSPPKGNGSGTTQ